jgi:hypothetical protein
MPRRGTAGPSALPGCRAGLDKRRAVETLLKDPEWATWSNREIARRCAVTHPFVAYIRESISGNRYQIDPQRLATRNGTIYAVNTANIGKRATAVLGIQPIAKVAVAGELVAHIFRGGWCSKCVECRWRSKFNNLLILETLRHLHEAHCGLVSPPELGI